MKASTVLSALREPPAIRQGLAVVILPILQQGMSRAKSTRACLVEVGCLHPVVGQIFYPLRRWYPPSLVPRVRRSWRGVSAACRRLKRGQGIVLTLCERSRPGYLVSCGWRPWAKAI